MNNEQTIHATATLLLLLICLNTTTNVYFLLTQDLALEEFRQRSRKRKRGNDDVVLSSSIAIQLPRNFRRFWMDVRSSHWIYNVWNGKLLQESEFDRLFRLGRCSFETLHTNLR